MEGFKCRCGGETLVPSHKRIVTQGPDIVVINGVPCEKCTQCGQSYLTPQVTKTLMDLVKLAGNGPLVAVREIPFLEVPKHE